MFRPGVGKQVLTEPIPELATEPTNVANVSVAVGVVMHSHVWMKIPRKAECTTADQAQIRLHAQVNRLVGGQLGKERECLIASAEAVRSPLEKFLIWSCK